MKLSGKVYEVLKWLVLIVMPAVASAFYGLAKLWDWDIPVDSITGTIAIIETLIGAIIGISTHNYYKEQGDEKDDN